MKKTLAFFLLCIMILFSAVVPVRAAETQGIVTDMVWTSRNDGDPPFVRIVLNLSRSVKAEAAIDEAGKNLQVILKNTTKKEGVAHQYDMDPRAVDFATLSENNRNTYLDVALTKSQKMENIRVFALRPDPKAGKPHRLVVDIPILGAKRTYYKPTPAAAKTEVKPQAAPQKEKPTTKSKKTSTEPVVIDTTTSVSAYPISDAAKNALRGKVICIDPGHGGTDSGAIGHLNGQDVYEKNLTLAIAKPLRELLTRAGAKVVMTRTSDKDVYGPYAEDIPELQARCDIANEAHANAFISIHIDAVANPNVDGITAYYFVGSDESLILAHMMHRAALAKLTNYADRGVRGNTFYVNAHTEMPSVLMEMGYITNEDRLRWLTSKGAPQKIAIALYHGFVDYFTEKNKEES